MVFLFERNHYYPLDTHTWVDNLKGGYFHFPVRSKGGEKKSSPTGINVF